MAADRGAYICQSQSLNLFVENPTYGKLSSMHFYGWKRGLKTGMYYLRSKAAVDPIKFTLSEEHQKSLLKKKAAAMSTTGASADAEVSEPEIVEGEVCTMEDGCLMCGS